MVFRKKKVRFTDRPIFNMLSEEFQIAERFPRARRNIRRARTQASRPFTFIGMNLARDLREVQKELRKKKSRRKKK